MPSKTKLPNLRIDLIGRVPPEKGGSGCTLPLPEQKSGELRCHPSRNPCYSTPLHYSQMNTLS